MDLKEHWEKIYNTKQFEAGWVVTEVGRQPWMVYNIMRTSDAVTPMPGLKFSFYLYVTVYAILAAMVTWLMHRQIKVLNNSIG